MWKNVGFYVNIVQKLVKKDNINWSYSKTKTTTGLDVKIVDRKKTSKNIKIKKYNKVTNIAQVFNVKSAFTLKITKNMILKSL